MSSINGPGQSVEMATELLPHQGTEERAILDCINDAARKSESQGIDALDALGVMREEAVGNARLDKVGIIDKATSYVKFATESPEHFKSLTPRTRIFVESFLQRANGAQLRSAVKGLPR